MGQSPKSGAVSLRTFNRNFNGRSGTLDADVYLVSPETAAISAITGVLTDGLSGASEVGIALDSISEAEIARNSNFTVFDEANNVSNTEVVMGPNIKPFPRGSALTDTVSGTVVLHAGDNITTDDIMPSDSRLLPYRSNIPYLSEFCFEKIDMGFSTRAKDARSGVIIGGDNYGQGSSREHAALAPLYLGIRFVIAKSFARIHRSNLINSGIIPLVFEDTSDYEKLQLGTKLTINDAITQIESGDLVTVKNDDNGESYKLIAKLTDLEKKMILAGGKINMLRGV
jgi:aconitate hydratase